MMVIKVLVLIGLFGSESKSQGLMPNLPVGEYRTIYNKIYRCESTKDHKFIYNIYFNKKTSMITELKGNTTFLVPFDDTLTFDLNFSSWSLTGGWKPNSMVYITKQLCSKTKNIAGNVWNSIVKAFNISTTNCPLPAGTYVTSGINLKELEDHNFPKVYFYGKYKSVFKIKNDENKVLGCGVVEVNLVRPWENPV